MNQCYRDLETLALHVEMNKDKALFIDNMRNYLARRNATIIWGNGCLLETNDEKLQKFWNKYYRKNRLNELFFWNEEVVSKNGRSMLHLMKTKNGEWKIMVADPWFMSFTAKSFYTEELAVIWSRPYQDMSTMYMKTIYTKTYMETQYVNEKGELISWDQTVKLDKESMIEPGRIYHNLGFVPVVEIQNYPNKNLYYTFPRTLELTDWYNAISFESLAYQAYKDFKKELKLNHSRVFIEGISQNAAQKIARDAYDLDDLNRKENVLGDYVININNGSKVTVTPGVGDFSIYSNALNSILDFYCKFANSSRFSEGDSVQKSSQEMKTTRSAQVESIIAKISLREERYSELLAKLFAANKLMEYDQEELPFVLKINGNLQKEETVFLDNVTKQVNLGTMSLKEAISKLRNIPLSQAQKIFEEIQEFNEENELVTSLQGVELDEEQGPYDNVGGEGRPEETSEDLKE